MSCPGPLVITPLPGLPRIRPGDDLVRLLDGALAAAEIALVDHDVIVVVSKLVAKAEGRRVNLAQVAPSPRAIELAAQTGKDARLVEVVLWDTERVSRAAKNALVVRHHGGHVSANAGIDLSNAQPEAPSEGEGPWVLRLPVDPDASAERLRAGLAAKHGVRLGVIVSDSFGRPLRVGTVGVAIGVAGFPPVHDQRGERDLDGRTMEATITAPADQLAAVCDLVAGQAAEGRGAVHVRGLLFDATCRASARDLCRPPEGDLYL